MVRGRARLPFLLVLLAASIAAALTVSPDFFGVTAGVLANVAAVARPRDPEESRPDRAVVADWFTARRARQRDR